MRGSLDSTLALVLGPVPAGPVVAVGVGMGSTGFLIVPRRNQNTATRPEWWWLLCFYMSGSMPFKNPIAARGSELHNPDHSRQCSSCFPSRFGRKAAVAHIVAARALAKNLVAPMAVAQN